MIEWNISQQVKQAANLLLRIEKKKILHSIKTMGEQALIRRIHDKNVQEFNFLVRKRLGLLNIVTPVSTTVNSHNIDKKAIVKHRIQKITDPQDSLFRSSYFVNPPDLKLRKSLTKIGILVILALIPQIVNFLILIRSYHKTGHALTKTFTLTAASQSAQTMLGIYRRQYKETYFNSKFMMAEVEKWILSNGEQNFRDVMAIEDPFLKNRMEKTEMCPYAMTILNITSLKEPNYVLCHHANRMRKNITIMEVYHLFSNYLKHLKDMIPNKDRWVEFKQFLASQDTAFNDVNSYYLIVA